MIVLDTNVVSEMMRQAPAPRVTAWLASEPADRLAITAITAAELLYGVARLPTGRRRNRLAAAIEDVLELDFPGRILPFDTTAAGHYGALVAGRESAGRPISAADAQIAAICRRHAAALATRNVSDFTGTGVDLIDPWSAI